MFQCNVWCKQRPLPSAVSYLYCNHLLISNMDFYNQNIKLFLLPGNFWLFAFMMFWACFKKEHVSDLTDVTQSGGYVPPSCHSFPLRWSWRSAWNLKTQHRIKYKQNSETVLIHLLHVCTESNTELQKYLEMFFFFSFSFVLSFLFDDLSSVFSRPG